MLGVGLTALIRGHLRWARIPSRKTAGVTLIVGVLLVGIGGALTPPAPVGHCRRKCDLLRAVRAVDDLDNSHDGTGTGTDTDTDRELE